MPPTTGTDAAATGPISSSATMSGERVIAAGFAQSVCTEVLNTLDQCALAMFADRVAALPSRFDNVTVAAAELCEPEIQFIHVPRRTLKSDADIDAWAEEVKQQLKAALPDGPISVK